VASWLISRDPVEQAQNLRILLKGIYNMLEKSKKLSSWITTLLDVIFLSVNCMKHLRGNEDMIPIVDFFL
jgi:hypothetical protein